MKQINSKRTLFAAIALVVLIGQAGWSERGKAKGNRGKSDNDSRVVVVVLGDEDRHLIRDWFWTNRNSLPPGLAKRETLPPGLAKQLRRNGALPPGLQKKLHPLPVSLEGTLVGLPGDLMRVIVGRDLLLLDRRSNTVLDVLPGVVYGPNDAQLYETHRRDSDYDDDRDWSRRDSNQDNQPYRSTTSQPVPSSPRVPVATAPPKTASSAVPAHSSPTINNAQSFPLRVRLTRTISTASAQSGEGFTATLEEPLYENGRIVARQGATVEGVIADADKGGRIKGVASLTLQLERIKLQSGKYLNVSSDPVVAEANSTKTKDVAKVGITTGAGALIGAIAGGGKGAAIGAATGAAAGTGLVLVTRGDAAELPSETVVEFNIRSN